VDLAGALIGEDGLEVVTWRITGYSSVMPLAARMVRAERQMSSPSRALLSLAKADVLRCDSSLIFHPAKVVSNQSRLVELKQAC